MRRTSSSRGNNKGKAKPGGANSDPTRVSEFLDIDFLQADVMTRIALVTGQAQAEPRNTL